MEWTDALKVGNEVIDTDHEVFVAEVNAAVAASDEDFPKHFAELVEHTRAHFAREEAIMDATGFFATGIHKAEHQRVLAEVARVADRLEAGDATFARTLRRRAPARVVQAAPRHHGPGDGDVRAAARLPVAPTAHAQPNAVYRRRRRQIGSRLRRPSPRARYTENRAGRE